MEYAVHRLSLNHFALMGLFCFGQHKVLLPKPSGCHAVGTQVLVMVNQENQRDLHVQLWYPTSELETWPAPYIPDPRLVAAMQINNYMNLPGDVMESWLTMQTNAWLDAKPLEGNFPLVFLSHGFGMSKTNYSLLAIEMASHGYVVCAIDHPGSGFMLDADGSYVGLEKHPQGPDGKTVEFCDDYAFLIEQLGEIELKNIVDMTRIAVVGHSLGGAAALNVGLREMGVDVAVNLDGHVFGLAQSEGVKTPFLSVLQRPDFAGESVPEALRAERQQLWKNMTKISQVVSHIVRIKGLMHFDFSDFLYLVPEKIRRKNGGTLAGNRGHNLVCQLVVRFLDSTLKAKNPDLQNWINNIDEVDYELVQK